LIACLIFESIAEEEERRRRRRGRKGEERGGKGEEGGVCYFSDANNEWMDKQPGAIRNQLTEQKS